jgi:hypothetical protein
MTAITITPQTCRTELLSEYQRCCGYDLDNDVTLARQFIRVCRALLSPAFPQEAQSGGKSAASSFVIALSELSKQLATAEAWLRANDPNFRNAEPGGGVVYATVGNLRAE